ncbi:MAG: translocation/assembly module TamB domain-containing protein [Longimonas sp.]|uniref:translocation/assembly module TamB domain-containing protein n=1 Tax=Longimonas sp. TaxID=2039626 RepID=UPI003360FCEC
MTDSNTSSSSTPSAAPQSRLRTVGRRTAQGLGGVVALVLLLGLGLLLFLQTESGATRVAQWALDRFNPVEETTITIDRASGSWLGGLTLYGVVFERDAEPVRPDENPDAIPDTLHTHRQGPTVGVAAPRDQQLVAVDTVSVSYRLTALLGGTLHLTNAHLGGPAVYATQAPDATWNWDAVLAQFAADPDDEPTDLRIQIDRAEVSRGYAEIAFWGSEADSTAFIDPLTLRLRNVDIGETTQATLDTLHVRGELPDDSAMPLTLAARATLTPDMLTVNALQLDAPRSRLRSYGTLQFAAGPSADRDTLANDTDAPADALADAPTQALDEAAFAVHADSIAVADIAPFVPALTPAIDEVHRFTLALTQRAGHWQAEGSGQVNDAGTWRLNAEATLPDADTTRLHYRAALDIDQYVTRLTGTPIRVNASLDADLSGTTLETLSGTTRLSVRDTRFETLAVETLDLSATTTSGTVDLESQGRINATEVQLSGTTTPFGDVPAYDLTARADGLDLAEWLPDTELTSALNLDLTLAGSGIDPPTADLSTTLSLRPSTVHGIPIDALTATTTLQRETVQSDFQMRLPGGHVEGRGRAALDETEAFALEALRTTDFHLNAFLDALQVAPDLPDTRISGRISAEGQGFDPQETALSGNAEVSRLTHGLVQMDAIRAALSFESGTLQADIDAEGNVGRVQTRMAVDPFAEMLTVALRDGRLNNVNIGPLLQDESQASDLNGTFSARATQAEDRLIEAQLQTDLTQSRLNEQDIEALGLLVSLDDDERLTFDTTLRVPGGETRLAGTARLFDDRPSVNVTEGTIRALNVGALAGIPNLDTDLNGTLDFRGAGQSLEVLSFDGRLALSDSRINQAMLNESQLTLQADQGQVESDIRAQFDVGEAQATLNASLPDSSYTLTARATQFDGAALTGQDTLQTDLESLQFALEGKGWTAETASFTATLDAAAAEYGPLLLESAVLRSSYDAGRVHIDTLSVNSNVLTATAGGTASFLGEDAEANIVLNANLVSLEPLQTFTPLQTLAADTGSLTGRLRGEAGQLRFNGRLNMDNLIADDARVTNVEVILAGALAEDRSIDRVEGRTRLQFVEWTTLAADEVRANGTYSAAEGASLSTNVRASADQRARLDLSVPSFDEPFRASLTRLDLDLGADAWRLLQPVSIAQEETAIRIRNFLLMASDQQIAVDGRIDPEGDQSLVATLENVNAGPFAELMQIEGLGGRVNGTIDLSGPADAPIITMGLDTDVRSEGREVGTLNTELRYADLALHLNANLEHADGSTLTLSGDFPIDLRLRTPEPADVMSTPVDLQLDADAFAVGWIDPFLDPDVMEDLSGRLDAAVQIGGTRTDPNLQGDATLSALSIVLTDLNNRFTEGRAVLRLEDDRIEITESSIRSPRRGRMSATGSIELAELALGEMDLQIRADEFQAINTRPYRRGTINGDMVLTGTTERPRLTGTVQVVRADIFFDELDDAAAADIEAVSLTDEDRSVLERRFGVRLADADTTVYDTYQAMAIDMEVEIRRETWLRSRSGLGLNIQFNGDLDLRKEHDEDVEVFGTIDIVPERSTVEQFGQLFRVDEGTLTFNGPPDDPQMSFTAVYEQRARETRDTEVTITLNADGRLGDLDIGFSSEPPMSTSNILSYLATGRPADSFLGGGGGAGSGGDLAAQLAIGQASNFVENLAATQLGLDVVRLQVRPNGISYLTVGRYITPRFYASIEQPIDTGSSQTEVLEPDLLLEYELTNTFMARLLRRQSSLRLNFLYERAY